SMIRFDNPTPLDLLRRTFALPTAAFTMIEKEIERRLQELVEKGELAEEQVQQMQSSLMARLQQSEDRKPREKEETPTPSQSLLTRFNVPTHDDMQELAHRIDNLTERLDELIMATKNQQDEEGFRPDTFPPSDQE
nr:hypothetical protein [Ardenticatenales bacterium]